MAEQFEAGNLYDMNKNLIAKTQKILKGTAMENKINDVVMPYFKNQIAYGGHQYFMLLCHEQRDYTVFNLCCGQYFIEDKISDIALALKECIVNRGKVYAIDNTEDGIALEIWIQDDQMNMYCYYLFPYDEGIVEV